MRRTTVTRRPSVPKAQFADGLGSPPSKPDSAPAEQESQPPTGGPGRKKGKTGRAAGAKERRPASAPAPRRPEDGTVADAGHSPVPARSFSGRLLVLGLAMGVVTLLLAPNVHTYLEQRAEISALREDIAAREAQQGIYKSELARWDDPAYIKQQARDRVSMLMPGETGYWVYGAEELSAAEEGTVLGSGNGVKDPGDASTTAKDATSVTVEPWVDSLVNAVRESAKIQAPSVAPAEPSPAPAAPPVPVPAAP